MANFDSNRVQFTLQLETNLSVALKGSLENVQSEHVIPKLINKHKRKWRRKNRMPLTSSVFQPYPSDILESLKEINDKYETTVESLIESRKTITEQCHEKHLELLQEELQQLTLSLDRLQPHSTVHEPVTVTHPTSLDNVHQPSELLQKLNSVSISITNNCTLLQRIRGIDTKLPPSAKLYNRHVKKTSNNHRNTRKQLFDDNKKARKILEELQQESSRYKK